MIEAPALDQLSRVVDFGIVKELVGEWIDTNLDHNALLHPADTLIEQLASTGARRPYVMPDCNPTAEKIGEIILHVARQLIYAWCQSTGHTHIEDGQTVMANITVLSVIVEETPNCIADVSEINIDNTSGILEGRYSYDDTE
jgi:6-pyruvoyl-tetrahydropterin synthase